MLDALNTGRASPAAGVPRNDEDLARFSGVGSGGTEEGGVDEWTGRSEICLCPLNTYGHLSQSRRTIQASRLAKNETQSYCLVFSTFFLNIFSFAETKQVDVNICIIQSEAHASKTVF